MTLDEPADAPARGPMAVGEKDAIRKAFFAFCEEHGVSGWCVLTRITDDPGPLSPGVKGEPALGLSYMTGMHLPADVQTEAEKAHHTISAMISVMRMHSDRFGALLALTPAPRYTPLEHRKDAVVGKDAVLHAGGVAIKPAMANDLVGSSEEKP